ncbi:MAG: hypothetical protein MIO92_00965, partial [Methanosarcinaceae archaeon]|nr:hypothetical protein [Methanosarcinaceae archaeon]
HYSDISTSLNSHAGRTSPSGVKNLKNAALTIRQISYGRMRLQLLENMQPAIPLCIMPALE